MSLVMEALRRVEKPDARAGSIGAAVSSYEPPTKRRGMATPLLLGLAAGGATILLMSPPSRPEGASAANSAAPVASPQSLKGGAALPPPLIVEPLTLPEAAPSHPNPSAEAGLLPAALASPHRAPAPARPALVLQAISERDSRPIAVVSDTLVREGDWLGSTRVLKIGEDFLEVLLEDGRRDFVRFAPAPLPDISPTPHPS